MSTTMVRQMRVNPLIPLINQVPGTGTTAYHWTHLGQFVRAMATGQKYIDQFLTTLPVDKPVHRYVSILWKKCSQPASFRARPPTPGIANAIIYLWLPQYFFWFSPTFEKVNVCQTYSHADSRATTHPEDFSSVFA